MRRSRNVVVSSAVLATMAVVASAGGCGSGEEPEEHLGAQAQAHGLDGSSSDAGDAGCREITLQASRTANGGGRSEDERELSPPMRIAIPSEIAVSNTTNRGAKWIELKFELASGGEVECRYMAGGRNPVNRALLFSCSGGRRAGDILRANEVALEVDHSVATARIVLSEAPPCGPDAGTDASTSDTGGGGGDTGAADANPTCTPATCVPTSTCFSASCTPAGCTQTPLPLGSLCADGSVCTTNDACDGFGLCIGTPVVLPTTACLAVTCDPVLGIVSTPLPDATPCSDGNACSASDACLAGICVPGAPLDCTSNAPCMIDGCDPATGCTHSPKPALTPCGDGNACNGSEVCSALGICQAGTAPVCQSNNLCIVDSCLPATGCVQTAIPQCDPTPVQGDAPFETRASILGKLLASGSAVAAATFTVTNAPPEGVPPSAPRGDVSVSSASDGSFRVRLDGFPQVEADRSPPLHVLVRIEAGGYLPAYRDAWLHSGSAVDLGEVKLVARDPAVTMVGPAGGTASDSQGRIQVVIPPGALAATVPIRITPIANRDEMTAPLPESTSTVYGYELEPSGTTFAVPVTVRLSNWRNVPTALGIPAAFYDVDRGRWEHVGVATWDGTAFAFQTTHFSPGDVNGVSLTPPNPILEPGHDKDPKCDPAAPCCEAATGSSCGRLGGALNQKVALPTYRVKNEDFGVALAYSSGLAGARRLGTAPSNYGAVNHSTFSVSVRGTRVHSNAVPFADTFLVRGNQAGLCTATTTLGDTPSIPLTLTRTLAGSTTRDTISMGPLNSEAEFDGYVDLPMLSPTSAATTGLYRTHLELSMELQTSCSASGGTFGVTNFASAGTPTALAPGPIASVDTLTLVHHRLTSPFGAGWALRDVSRLYRDGNVAYLVSGEGSSERFGPRAHAKGFGQTPLGQILARDPHTGEIFSAYDSGGIARVDALTGTLTPVLSGLGFNVPVHGLAIAYVGGSRTFVVALHDRLLEIDAGGGQRVLSTRATTGLSQAAVTAREDVVFYTAGLASPTLYRVRLSDPARTVEGLSQVTGGDVRLFPQAPLSGVTLADPRGLAFGADGTLYVADRGRNTVYAVRPDASGNIAATSQVEPVMGNGMGTFLPTPGERQPGVRFSLREPLSLSMTEDGRLFVGTTYGIASFDPVAKEGEALLYWGGIDELTVRPALTRVSVLGLSAGVALSRAEISAGPQLIRFDIDALSSEREPTRTLKKLTGGQLELTDTTNDVVETFDAAGRLVARHKRTGELVMTLSYVDATGDAVDRLTDAAGGETIFTYASGKVRSVTDPRGRVTTLTVSALGDLESVTEPGSETQSFAYASHRMTEKRSARGDLTRYTYRADGTLESATKPEGGVTLVDAALSHPPVFNAEGKVERRGTVTDARGVLHETAVNGNGVAETDTHTENGVTRVDRVTYAPTLSDVTSVNGTSFFLDFASERRNRFLRIAARTQNGVQLGTTMEYDAHGRRFRERRPFGSADVHRWIYDAKGFLLEDYQGPSNMADRYERDAVGHVTRIFDRFLGGTTETGRERRWTYRADGLPLTTVDHGVTRTYSYEELPGALNELGWTDTLGRSMTYARDSAGNVTSTSDGVATTYAAYDAKNRVTETRDALNNTTTYGYTNAGCGCSQENLVTSIHTPDLPAGVDWTMAYDHDGRLASTTDPHAFTESYGYEVTGEVKRMTDKLSRDTTWTHDQLGRVLAMVDTLGRSHGNAFAVPSSGAWVGPTLMAGSGDATSPSTSLTAPLRSGDYQIGHNVYQPYGAPPAISLYRDATFALGYSHNFDVANRLTYRSDRTAFAIDSVTIPSQVTTPFWYEVRTYNTNTSRPVPQDLQSATAVGVQRAFFTQNAEFDLTQASGISGAGGGVSSVESYTRDVGGRPTELRRRLVGSSLAGTIISTYTYWPDGRLKQLVNPDGTHDFTYDARGLMLTQVVSGEGTYTHGYDVMGRASSLTYPDGHVRTQLYDELGRMTSRCYEYSGPTERCYTAQYDAVGNPTRMADPDGVDIFTYDALDRLKKVTREVGGVSVGVEDYDYNALGALKLNAGIALQHQRPRLDGAGNADAAVPASLGGLPVTLDAGGRVTSLRGTTLSWNRLGYLDAAQDPIPAVGESYRVDSSMRRIMKTGTDQEFYIYEGLDRVATLDAIGAIKETYLFDGIDHPLRIKVAATNTTAYYEVDLAGNVRGLRASGGASLGGYRYSAFGQTLEDTTGITQPLRWKGRWFSPVAGGTYDVRARQWSPELGSSLSVDEFEFHDKKATLWGWPNQNPIRFSDPTGRDPEVVLLGPAAAGPVILDLIVSAYLAYLAYEALTNDGCSVSAKTKSDRKRARCIAACQHLLPDPQGDLQSSNFHRCVAQCMAR